jgi:hypothetical protein
MSARDELAAAVARCAYACPECGSSLLGVVLDAGEWIPDVAHWADLATGYACPALEPESAAMARCWLDVWASLGAAGYPVADYGEPDPRQTMVAAA